MIDAPTLPVVTVASDTLIPAETLRTWKQRSYRSALLKLTSLLELRPLIEDAKAEGQRVLMQMYSEAADAMMVHPDTVRADLAIIRNYSPDKLMYWLSNRVSFAHIETANQYAEIAKKTPAQLLDEAIQLGDETGETMTVSKLIAFALGEKKHEPATFRANALFSRLGKFPNLFGWAQDKTEKFNQWLDYGRKEFLG